MKPEDLQQRVDELFAEVVGLPESEREQYLDAACANDPPEVRIGVEKLLALDQEVQADSGFLGRPPLKEVASEMNRALADEGDEAQDEARVERQHSDRNLLFSIVALQLDLVTRDQLIGAMHAWVLAKHRPLGEILVEQAALQSSDREMLEAMVDRHVQLHDDDPKKSLAGLSSIGSPVVELQSLGDPDVEQSLANISAARSDGLESTNPWHGSVEKSIGTSTSTGDRFQIIRFHKGGGLGDVYLARDTELNREVALKNIKAWHSDNLDSRGRFVLEAEITGGLEHPGIVPVYGLGQDDKGRPFYAMRFIKGNSLRDAVNRFHSQDDQSQDSSERSVEFRKLLGRFVDVCDAMEYAHSRGVLHRDLKPGNIMLGKYGETLLVDWGLAKVAGRTDEHGESDEATLRPSSASGSTPTQLGQALGTPAYMSPEQAAGMHDMLGPATDVYGLGATLFTVLTGKPPFDDVTESLEQVKKGQFRNPRDINAVIERPLEAICLKAMATSPGDRYGSPRELANDVENWLADAPVTAWPEPLFVRAKRWMRHHQTLVTSTSAAILVGLVVLSSLLGALATLNSRLNSTVTQLDTAVTELDSSNRQLREEKANLRASNTKLEEETIRANENAELARDNAKEAARQADTARGNLYIATLSRLQEAWSQGRVNSMSNLLASVTPSALGGRIDYREFEWYLLSRMANRIMTQFERLADRAEHSATTSGDGSLSVTWKNYKIAVHLTGSNETLWETTAPLRPGFMRISPNNRFVVAVSNTRVQVWDATNGKSLHQTTPLSNRDPSRNKYVHSFSDGGTRLAYVLGETLTVLNLDGETLKSWDASVSSAPKVNSPPGILQFSPGGGEFLVVAGQPWRRCEVWDSETGQRVKKVAFNDFVYRIAFSPDVAQLACASLQTFKIVGLEPESSDIEIPKAHLGQRIRAVSFNPDGSTVVTGDESGACKLWSVADQRALVSLHNHDEEIFDVAFSSDGKLLATSGLDDVINIWSVGDGRLLNTLRMSERSGVEFESDSEYLIASSRSGTYRFHYLDDQRCLTFRAHQDSISDISISSDGRYIASASSFVEPTVRVWDARTAKEYFVLRGKRGFSATTLAPDNEILAVADGRRVSIWDWQSGTLKVEFEANPADVSSLSFNKAGTLLAVGSRDGTLTVWDWRARERKQYVEGEELPEGYSVEVEGKPLSGIAFGSHTSTQFLGATDLVSSATSSGRLVLLNASTGTSLESQISDAIWMNQMKTVGDVLTADLAGLLEDWSVHAASGRIAVISKNRVLVLDLKGSRRVQEVAVFNMKDGGKQRSVYDGELRSVCFSDSGRRIALGTSNGIYLCSVATGEQLLFLPTKGKVNHVRFSSDDLTLVSAEGNVVKVWDTITLDYLHDQEILKGHSSAAVACRMAGGVLSTAGRDGRVFLWEDKTGKQLLAELPSPIVAVDGNKQGLVVACEDSILRLWNKIELDSSPIEILARRLTDISLSADGRRVATCDEDGKVVVYAVKEDRALTSAYEHADKSVAATFHPIDSHLLVILGSDGKVRCLDMDNRDVSFAFEAELKESPQHLALSFNGEKVATLYDNGTAFIWTFANTEEPKYKVVTTSTDLLRFVPGESLLVTSNGNKVVLFDYETGKQVGETIEYRDEVNDIHFVSDTRFAVSVGDGSVFLADITRAFSDGGSDALSPVSVSLDVPNQVESETFGDLLPEGAIDSHNTIHIFDVPLLSRLMWVSPAEAAWKPFAITGKTPGKRGLLSVESMQENAASALLGLGNQWMNECRLAMSLVAYRRSRTFLLRALKCAPGNTLYQRKLAFVIKQIGLLRVHDTRSDAGRSALDEALARYQKIIEQDDSSRRVRKAIVEIHGARGDAFVQEGKRREAEKAYGDAIAMTNYLIETTSGKISPLSDAALELALVDLTSRRDNLGKEIPKVRSPWGYVIRYEQAIERLRDVAPKAPTKDQQENIPEAVSAYRRLAGELEALPRTTPTSFVVYASLCNLHRRSGQADLANDNGVKAAAVLDELLARGMSRSQSRQILVTVFNDLALNITNRPREAETLLRRALENLEGLSDQMRSTLSWPVHQNLGLVLLRQDNIEAAVDQLQTALTISDANQRAKSQASLALAIARSGNPKKAAILISGANVASSKHYLVLYWAAATHATCMELTQGDTTIDIEERKTSSQRHLDQILKLLNRAVEHSGTGEHLKGLLQTERTFDSIRDNEQFRQIVKKLDTSALIQHDRR